MCNIYINMENLGPQEQGEIDSAAPQDEVIGPTCPLPPPTKIPDWLIAARAADAPVPAVEELAEPDGDDRKLPAKGGVLSEEDRAFDRFMAGEIPVNKFLPNANRGRHHSKYRK